GLQALSQALQTASNPTLDGTQGVARQPRDVLVRIAADESELQAIALLVREQREAALQQPGRRQPRCGILAGVFAACGALGQLGHQHWGRPLVTKKVDRTIARNRDHPGHGTATGGAELSRSLPDADEHVLQRFFCKRTAAKDPRETGKQERRGELIQSLESAG